MTAPIIPALRYRDARAAIDFLQRAFGLEPMLVVPGDGDRVAHAQLRLGAGMVMLGSAGEGEFDALVAPLEPGARPAGSVYLVVESDDAVDAHAAQARGAGADIVVEPHDEDHGGRSYTCRDPEGQIWTIGSYDPWI